MGDQAGKVEIVRRVRRVGLDPLDAPAEQRDRAPGVVTLQMGEADRELRQALPHVALRGLGGLPRRLEHLVRLERKALVQQSLGLAHGLVRGEDEIVGHPVDADGAVWQRAAAGVPRSRVAGPAGRVTVAGRHGRLTSSVRW